MSARRMIGRKIRRELTEELEDGSVGTETLNGVIISYRHALSLFTCPVKSPIVSKKSPF
jgi:hypothetical protein